MFEFLIFYCLLIFFWFYLLNNSDILAPARGWIYPKLSPNIAYALQCIFCSTFWATLILAYIGYVPFFWTFQAPVVTLFMLKIFNFISVEDKIPKI